ncbi:hypothetical protein EDC05_000833 [Coemansia umbellata]|uniref:Sm domain-containing protein n=1 Tax=Coemansia umbellata TaxID=1424467 RepID=A0ABQ8PTS7_9FUNG|nr:hypothetical protein EDC05_000833 [Coemansia umbellata]
MNCNVSSPTPITAKETLGSYLNYKMQILCKDGRKFTGTFRCVDSKRNIILFNTNELRKGNERHVGMIMVPGEHIQQALVENLEADAITTSLVVTEEYKSFILAGLNPSDISDICSRALSFWSYQVSQEIAFQQAAAKAQHNKSQVTESRASAAMAELQERLRVADAKILSMQQSFSSERQKRALVEDSLKDKSRQLRRIKANGV